MKKIILDVEDKNLETVIMILENLKNGLISNIENCSVTKEVRKTQYQPKSSSVIYEHESGTNDISGKYSTKAYKARLKK